MLVLRGQSCSEQLGHDTGSNRKQKVEHTPTLNRFYGASAKLSCVRTMKLGRFNRGIIKNKTAKPKIERMQKRSFSRLSKVP